jgi:hypothetical protein
MTKEQMAKRFALIREDAYRIHDFILNNGLSEDFRKPTGYSDEAWTLLVNILIACDLDCKEADGWKLSNDESTNQ